MSEGGEAGQAFVIERRGVVVVVAEYAKRGACAEVAVRNRGTTR